MNTYLSAMKRHIDEFAIGVDRAWDSGVPHLAHVAAGCIILLDAMHAGIVIDDRYAVPGFEDVLREVAALKAGWVADKAVRDAA
ncbi:MULTISPECIES: dATP/dGTP diphosphohydrolase domain-containing protein [Methylobacterium]|uniref:dATP/dGTP diphosphohydrolase N-terminal domain-containing protein n=2 Tax=Methylobacterium TaxID=407 RepID=A0A0C6FSS8_9HYPH|nr:dATP/dGTP diphosphohydrolase domain-containing protein [Methylobacterium aquaticum]QRE77186.1 hypothetical protein F1D61_29870 [Methylobacterium aquaticum]BAQ45915.1 hypothetical protein Maq22A_c13505 [Methylobacterium aquaticum]